MMACIAHHLHTCSRLARRMHNHMLCWPSIGFTPLSRYSLSSPFSLFHSTEQDLTNFTTEQFEVEQNEGRHLREK